MYKLRNYSEYIIDYIFEDILREYTDICKCEKCKLDIKAIALNKLGSNYIVTDKGELYRKLGSQLSTQEIANVTKVITEAIEIVSKHPQHD